MEKHRLHQEPIRKLETYDYTGIEVLFLWQDTYIELAKCLPHDQQILEIYGRDTVLPIQTTAIFRLSCACYTTGIFSDNMALIVID